MGRKNRRSHGCGHREGEFRTTLASQYYIDKESGEEVRKPVRYVAPKPVSKTSKRHNYGKKHKR